MEQITEQQHHLQRLRSTADAAAAEVATPAQAIPSVKE